MWICKKSPPSTGEVGVGDQIPKNEKSSCSHGMIELILSWIAKYFKEVLRLQGDSKILKEKSRMNQSLKWLYFTYARGPRLGWVDIFHNCLAISAKFSSAAEANCATFKINCSPGSSCTCIIVFLETFWLHLNKSSNTPWHWTTQESYPPADRQTYRVTIQVVPKPQPPVDMKTKVVF